MVKNILLINKLNTNVRSAIIAAGISAGAAGIELLDAQLTDHKVNVTAIGFVIAATFVKVVHSAVTRAALRDTFESRLRQP